ncbi:MAG: FG-GAP-like repeat-containing protein, partial [Patescibacteria group bacterium]
MKKSYRLFLFIIAIVSIFFVGFSLCYAGFLSAVDYGVGNHPRLVFAADLDGDGDDDLATANYSSNSVSILVNNGDGTFVAAVNYAVGNRPATVFAADLDGDGDNDLAVANYYSDNVSVLLNNGDGT